MSGGQQQRVALARALVAGGDLVLFDEPLSNVDAKVREQLRFELLSMQRELGFAAVYVTHDQAEAMELAHRIAVMGEGSIVQVDPPRRIYTEPATRYVASFVGTSNELEGTVTSVDQGFADIETAIGSIHGVPSEGVTAGASAIAMCRPERLRLGPTEPETPNRWRGEVRASAFLGANIEHVVDVADRTFRVWSVDTRLLDPGTEVWMSVDPRARPRAPTVNDFDPLAPETFTSFHEEFADLRQRCPVAHTDAYNGFWALTRYDDVVAAVQDPATFTTTVQNVVPKLAFTGRRPPLHLDPPEHTPYRAALNPYFTPEKMRRIEPRLRAVIGGLLEPLVGAGDVDICEAYTYRLPGYVFAEFFNLPPELGLRIRDASREFNVAVQDFVDEEVKRTSLQLYDIAREIIAMRKAEPLDPADDPASGLLATGLPEDMLLGTIRQFIVVGMIAPSVFIGSMVIHLAEHEDVQQQLRADPTLVPAAVDEYLRLLTPYRGFARTTTRDVEIRARSSPRTRRSRWCSPPPTATRTSSPSPTDSSSTGRTSDGTSPSASGRIGAPARRSGRSCCDSRSMSSSAGRRASR